MTPIEIQAELREITKLIRGANPRVSIFLSVSVLADKSNGAPDGDLEALR